MSATREDPYHTLKHVDTKPLWDFPGHDLIRNDWFRHLLLYDSGSRELVVDVIVAEDCDVCRKPEALKYVSGRLVVAPGRRVVVGEEAVIWKPSLESVTREVIVEWKSVVDVESRAVA